MKAEHEAESTFDRISTREELCEVIDLLCDRGKARGTGRLRQARHSGRVDSLSADTSSVDLAYEIDEDPDEDEQEADELGATLTDFLSGDVGWLN